MSQATSLAAGQVVALDGKTARGSFDRRREQSPLHVVSAWATEQSLALAQYATDEKSNEITVLPEVLGALHLEGALVTIDARVGCQKKIARRITRGNGDYLLTLKTNHRKAYQAVEAHFEHSCLGRSAPRDAIVRRRRYDAFDDSHGRVVRRRVFSCGNAARLEALSGWPGLKSVEHTKHHRPARSDEPDSLLPVESAARGRSGRSGHPAALVDRKQPALVELPRFGGRIFT